MSSSKHVVNDPRALVDDSLQGLARLNPAVKVDQASRVVHLAKVPKARVALASTLSLTRKAWLSLPVSDLWRRLRA